MEPQLSLTQHRFRDGLAVVILKAAVLALAMTGVAYAATRAVLRWTGV